MKKIQSLEGQRWFIWCLVFILVSLGGLFLHIYTTYETNDVNLTPFFVANKFQRQSSNSQYLKVEFLRKFVETGEYQDVFQEKVSLKISGTKNETVDLGTYRGCIYGESLTPPKNSIAYLHCYYAGYGDEFTVYREQPDLLVVKYRVLEEVQTKPVEAPKTIKSISIPKNSIIK